MHHEYTINHETKRVTRNGYYEGQTLLSYNAQEELYSIHQKGQKYFGGQGRPQNYSPACIAVYKPTKIINVDNATQIIHTQSPLLKWDVKR